MARWTRPSAESAFHAWAAAAPGPQPQRPHPRRYEHGRRHREHRSRELRVRAGPRHARVQHRGRARGHAVLPPLRQPGRVRLEPPVRLRRGVRAGLGAVVREGAGRVGPDAQQRAPRGVTGRERALRAGPLPHRRPEMSDRRSEFLARSERGGVVPLTREVLLDADTPLAVYQKVARPPFSFLLESLVGGERWARYTFLGTDPREAWRYRGRSVERWTKATGW